MSDTLRLRRTRLSTRLLLYFAVAYLALIGLLGLSVYRLARGGVVDSLTDHLLSSARLVSASLPGEEESMQSWAEAISEAGGFRTTVIAADGIVLADSYSDPAAIGDVINRPEVAAALSGKVGTTIRMSVTTRFDQLYVALPPSQGLILRVSIPASLIETEQEELRSTIVAVSLLVGVVGVAVLALLARRLARPFTELASQSLQVSAGNLGVTPRRSSVQELDQLGVALSTLALELRRRSAEADQAGEYLEIVLGALPQGTVLVEADDRIAYANPAAYQLLGSVPEYLGGLVPFPYQTAVREARERRHPVERLLDHGKPARRLKAVATPFVGSDRILLIVADVTAQERVASVRRDFVANASHELKTPVSTILASAEALHTAVELGDGTAPGFAKQIAAAAHQLDRLVGDLLDLSRLEREEPTLAPVRLDLLVGDEVERFRPRAEDKGLSLAYSSEPTSVMAGHADMGIAVRNLLDNALQYTPQEGKVEVSVHPRAGEAMVRVSDTGEGIPMRDLDRVFERFYRVDTARSRATGGTGLGLSIVKHVAESHGGSVTVESELGVGSTFTIRLPLAGEGAITEDR